MSGQRIPLVQRLRDGFRILWKHRTKTSREVRTYFTRFESLVGLLKEHVGKTPSGSRVVEFGCGQRALVPLAFAASGAESWAVDVESPTYEISFRRLRDMLRRNGAERMVKSLARHVLFDRRFFREFESVSGLKMKPFPKITQRVGDAAHLDFPQEHFDLIYSFAVLEHVADVGGVLSQMRRVLRPEGVGRITVHLFPSLTGGHCMDWQYALDPSYPEFEIPHRIPPWDHLRENLYPANTYLNRWRLDDFRREVTRQFRVLEEELVREGEDLLHLAPADLLREYTATDLTTSVVRFIVRKK